MYNNDYMYAIERNGEYLAHYGVRGMKWGVRKAIQSGNSARLSRQYAKASKKLAKLEKQAGKSKKYARRAALMGAGAAIAGGAAALGTEGVGRVTRGIGAGMARGSQAAGRALANVRGKSKAAQLVRKTGEQVFLKGSYAGIKMQGAGGAINRWGKGTDLSQKIGKAAIDATGTTRNVAASAIRRNAAKLHGSGITNNTIARIGAGAVGAGLAAGAARNAYKAATAQKKAAKFKSEMNKAFAGTKYANGGNRQGGKKRRRR